MNALDLFGDTDPDNCPNCGVNSQATHAPWCEERDGTPVDATDPVYFAGKLAVAIVANHGGQCVKQPNWSQAVLVSLHDQLADTYLREDDSGDRYLTRIEQRTLANWLEHHAQQYRINR